MSARRPPLISNRALARHFIGKRRGVAAPRETRLNRSAFSVLVIVTIFLSLIALGISLFLSNAGLAYTSVGFMSFGILLTPNLFRKDDFDFLEPINIAAAAVLFGTALRGIYL